MAKHNHNIENIALLSPTQEGIFFHSMYMPSSNLYLNQIDLEIRGDLRIGAFEKSWEHLIERHSILRAAFISRPGKKACQIIYRRLRLPFVYIDWRNLSPAKQQEEQQKLLQADFARGFDLAKPPLMRLTLIRLSENHYHFVWTSHHIILDGWSRSLLAQEIFTFYQASIQNLRIQPRPARSYLEYVSWLEKKGQQSSQSYWRLTLAGFSEPTNLTTSRSWRSIAKESSGAETLRVPLAQQTTQALWSLARQRRITISTIMQAAWSLLLSCYTRKHDLVFGLAVSGRPPEFREIETMIGLFINILPVRVQIDPDRPGESWLREIFHNQGALQEHQHTPLTKIHQWSEVAPNLPLFDTLLVVYNYPGYNFNHPVTLAGLQIRSVVTHGAELSHIPLVVMLEAMGIGQPLALQIAYQRQHFDEDRIGKLACHLQMLLEGITAEQPLGALLSLIKEDERPPLISEQGLTGAESRKKAMTAPRTVIERFISRVWQEVLEIESIDIFGDFFELGGNSLQAVQIASQLSAVLHMDLPIHQLLDSFLSDPTIAGLAQALAISQPEHMAKVERLLASIEKMSAAEKERLLKSIRK